MKISSIILMPHTNCTVNFPVNSIMEIEFKSLWFFTIKLFHKHTPLGRHLNLHFNIYMHSYIYKYTYICMYLYIWNKLAKKMAKSYWVGRGRSRVIHKVWPTDWLLLLWKIIWIEIYKVNNLFTINSQLNVMNGYIVCVCVYQYVGVFFIKCIFI